MAGNEGTPVKRRDFLNLSAGLPLLGLAAGAKAATPATEAGATPLADAAREAFIYGLPLVALDAVRARSAAAGQPVNSFRHARAPSNPKTQKVTAPNNDTLASSAFIDLSAGPLRISVPPTGARYFSLQMMDAYTNTFCILGTRTTGPEGGEHLLVGPDQAAPPRAIRAPTPTVWALGRMLADGEADLPAAHRLQDGLKIVAGAAAPPPAGPPVAPAAPWPEFFAQVQRLLARNPPPATDDAVLRRIARLGLGPGGRFDPARFTAAERAQIAAGTARGRAEIQGLDAVFRRVGGWAYQSAQIGDYGQDYRLRAATCQWGIGALTAQEAMYARAAGEDGSYFYPGGTSWRLRFPKGGLPPVDAFWSLTLYRAEPDGKVYYFDNPAGRYSIGDRSGLTPGADGATDIWIGPDDPGGARSGAWLPAPPDGRFVLLMRAYLPRRAMVDGTYLLPPVERI
jgi:hypothetical protein